MTAGNLKVQEIAGKSAGPHLLITGGVHGDEFEPIAAIRSVSRLFAEQTEQGALLNGRLSLVSCVNEEAFLLGRRCASDGLDLARTCPGRSDGSITERTAWALSDLIRSADYYIDLHTGGTEFSIYPLAGYMLHPAPEVLESQRRMARAFRSSGAQRPIWKGGRCPWPAMHKCLRFIVSIWARQCARRLASMHTSAAAST